MTPASAPLSPLAATAPPSKPAAVAAAAALAAPFSAKYASLCLDKLAATGRLACRTVLRPARPYAKLRDGYDGGAAGGCKAVAGSPWPQPEEEARLRAMQEPSA